MPLKLGLISYSNSYPFLLEMQRHPVAGVQVEAHIPSELNRRLNLGELDLSAVSAFEYLQHESDYYLLPHWCINSKGFVKSVLLFSRVPLHELQGKTVMLTQHSATSAHLLKVLLHHYRIDIQQWLPHQWGNEQQCDALLLIGDPALRFHRPEFPFVMDLAEEWQKITQLPIVFAVAAIRRERLTGQEPKVLELLDIFQRVTLRIKQQGLGEDLALMAKAFPDLARDFEAYFKCLDFALSESCLSGLRLYADKLVKMEILPPSTSLTFAPL